MKLFPERRLPIISPVVALIEISGASTRRRVTLPVVLLTDMFPVAIMSSSLTSPLVPLTAPKLSQRTPLAERLPVVISRLTSPSQTMPSRRTSPVVVLTSTKPATTDLSDTSPVVSDTLRPFAATSDIPST